ncbi:MAG: RICIN domain-containing protein [Acidobacteriota bacterium]
MRVSYVQRFLLLLIPIVMASAYAVPASAGTLVGLAGKCLDVEGGSTANGTPVLLWECNEGNNQQWEFESSQSFYEVRGLAGRCLQPSANASEATLEIGPCGGLESRWQKSLGFPGAFSLVHVSTSLCMDVEEAGTANGTPIILYPCNGQANQTWSFEPDVVGPCFNSSNTLCLNGRRFEVQVEWRDFDGNVGEGTVLGFRSNDSGLFWFFESDNWELLVKVLDGCAINDHFWVFSAATTNVEYTLRVVDTETGAVQTYLNELGVSASAVTDTEAFATCP